MLELLFFQIYERLLKQQTVLRDMFTTRTFLSAMSRSETASPRDHAKAFHISIFDYIPKREHNLIINRSLQKYIYISIKINIINLHNIAKE